MREADLQRLIVDAAELGGWLHYHTHDSRRSNPGFPDLVMVRGGSLIFAELKSDHGRLTRHQRRWLEALANVDTITSGMVRPGMDADRLVERLTTREPGRTNWARNLTDTMRDTP